MPSKDVAVKNFFGGTNVAARVEKAKQLRRGVHTQKAKKGSEFPYLGAKNGETLFTFGQDNAPVPEGTLWAFNIVTAQTGWAYWYKMKKKQVLASIWDDNPVELGELDDISDLTDKKGNPIEWQPAYAWQLHAVNGPIKGTTVAYEGNANYMLDLSEQMIQLAANRMEEEESFFPIVRLYNDPWKSDDGLVSKHKFELYGWGDMQGEIAEEIKDFPTFKAKAAAKTRTRRRAA